MEERENNLAMMRAGARPRVRPGREAGEGVRGLARARQRRGRHRDRTRRTSSGSYYKRLYPADLRRWRRAVDGLREAADCAAERGHHPGARRTTRRCCAHRLRGHARHDARGRPARTCGLCLDAPLFQERQSDAYVAGSRPRVRRARPPDALRRLELRRSRRMAAWCRSSAPSFGGLINYKRFLAELPARGLRRAIVVSEDPPARAVKDHRIAGIEDIDRASRISLAYMKNLVMCCAGRLRPWTFRSTSSSRRCAPGAS